MSRYFTPSQREAIWVKDNGICGICGYKAQYNNWEADHITPWAIGGETTINNGMVSHPWCNRDKSSKIRAICYIGGYDD